MKNFPSVNDRILHLIENQLGGNKKKFAERIGFAPQVVFNIVSGRKSKPSFDVLEAIISSFDEVSPDWLLTGREPMLRGQSAPEAAPAPPEPPLPSLIEEIKSLSVKLGRLEAENEHLRAAIEAQKQEIEARQKEIEDKEREIKLLHMDHLKKGEPGFHTQYLESTHTPLPPENPAEAPKLLKSTPQEAPFTP